MNNKLPRISPPLLPFFPHPLWHPDVIWSQNLKLPPVQWREETFFVPFMPVCCCLYRTTSRQKKRPPRRFAYFAEKTLCRSNCYYYTHKKKKKPHPPLFKKKYGVFSSEGFHRCTVPFELMVGDIDNWQVLFFIVWGKRVLFDSRLPPWLQAATAVDEILPTKRQVSENCIWQGTMVLSWNITEEKRKKKTILFQKIIYLRGNRMVGWKKQFVLGMGSSLGSSSKARIFARILAYPPRPTTRIWAHEPEISRKILQ